MTTVKRTSLCAMCIALCYILPVAFHAVGLGSSISPMHIPVLLCGLVCGGTGGLICGVIGPILSSLLSGMPPMVMLLRMIPELCIYGFVSGMMMNLRTGKTVTDVYISLITAMLAGRAAGGIASAVFYTVTTGVYSVELWLTSYFAESIPGIAAHLLLVPLLYAALGRARVIMPRYAKFESQNEVQL